MLLQSNYCSNWQPIQMPLRLALPKEYTCSSLMLIWLLISLSRRQVQFTTVHYLH